MESLLAEFLLDLLSLCFPPCREYSFVLKLLIHPPDSDCRLHPLSYSAGSLASRGLHSSGRNRKWWCSQCLGWGWGQCALKAWEKPATPSQVGQSLERSGVFLEEEMWPGGLTWLCEQEPKPCSGQREEHAQNLRQGNMVNKRFYRDRGWLYVLRETRDEEDKGRSNFHCLKHDKLYTPSEQ